MIALKLTVLLMIAAPSPDPRKSVAADALTLRSGKVLLGQLTDPAPKGRVAMIVRRAWAQKEVPELLKAWEADEGPMTSRARTQRRKRLETWKRDRAASAAAGDRILTWIDAELGRLAKDDADGKSPLLVVSLKRTDVRQTKRAPEGSDRLLRLAWLCEFPAAESMTREELEDSLEGRGFDPSRRDPVNIDHLLPCTVESDARWLIRRAATEATYDRDLNFLEMGPMLVPDLAGRGGGMQATAMAGSLPDPTGLFAARDPATSPDRLSALVPRGRVAAVVTTQETDPERDASTVTTTLWTRQPHGTWAPQVSRSSTVRGADLPAEDPKAPGGGQDPQVSIAVSSFSFSINGQTITRSSRSGPRLGSASRKASEQARAAFEEELSRLAFKID